MSSSRRRGPSNRPRQKRPSQRLAPAAPTTSGADDGLLETASAAAPVRSRRMQAVATTRPTVLPRVVEYAYIGADLRRLLVISGVLLVLMVVLLAVVNR